MIRVNLSTRIRLLLIFVFAIVSLLGLSILAINSMQGLPYDMFIEPAGTGCTVQFVRPDKKLQSQRFPVPVSVPTPLKITLDRSGATIPGGTITFCDTTFLPGQFNADFRGPKRDE